MGTGLHWHRTEPGLHNHEQEACRADTREFDMTSKYHNVKTVVDGISFSSKKEAARYQKLKLLEKAGEISGLQLQKRFSLEVSGTRVCTYVADFFYHENNGFKIIIEDCKGFKTPVYRLKKKLMKACYGIDILES
jgi:hypothetical protein